MSKLTEVAAAVAATAEKPAGDAARTMVTFEGKDSEGKPVLYELAVSKQVLGLIADGMKQADRLDKFWHKNADVLVEEFFGESPFPGLTTAAMTAAFRDSDEIDTMYGVFQTRHPEYARAMREQIKSKNNPDSDEAKSAAGAYREAMLTIRRTANNQAIKVCRYYAQAHGADAATESRQEQSARQIIEATIKEWATKSESGRGVFKLQAEKDLMILAFTALRAVLSADTVRKASSIVTLTLSLEQAADIGADMHASAAVKAGQRDRSAEKAGAVTVLTGAEAQAAVAQ